MAGFGVSMRIRTIKPEMGQHEDLAELSPWAQLLATRILCYADDEGYFKANPALIKSACFPLITEASLKAHGGLFQVTEELVSIGYLRFCKGSDGKGYGQVTNFLSHQRISRPSPSKLKGLCEFTEASLNPHGRLTDGSTTEQGTGNREQGKDSKKNKPKKETFNPLTIELPDWLPREAWAAWVDSRNELPKSKRLNTLSVCMANIKVLDKHRKNGHHPVDVITHSAAGRFQGLYPDNSTKAKGNGTTRLEQQTIDRRAWADSKAADRQAKTSLQTRGGD